MMMMMLGLLMFLMMHLLHLTANSMIHVIYLIHTEFEDLPFRPFLKSLLSNLHRISIDHVRFSHWMWSNSLDFDLVFVPNEFHIDNLNKWTKKNNQKQNIVDRQILRFFLRVVSNKYKFIPESRNACRNWYWTCWRFLPEIFVICRRRKKLLFFFFLSKKKNTIRSRLTTSKSLKRKTSRWCAVSRSRLEIS